MGLPGQSLSAGQGRGCPHLLRPCSSSGAWLRSHTQAAFPEEPGSHEVREVALGTGAFWTRPAPQHGRAGSVGAGRKAPWGSRHRASMCWVPTSLLSPSQGLTPSPQTGFLQLLAHTAPGCPCPWVLRALLLWQRLQHRGEAVGDFTGREAGSPGLTRASPVESSHVVIFPAARDCRGGRAGPSTQLLWLPGVSWEAPGV